MVYVEQISNRIRKEPSYVRSIHFQNSEKPLHFPCVACDEPKPSLPSPCEFGWRSNNDSYEAVTTKELPAPAALIELIFCGCTKYKNNRCQCFKADLVCTEMCN